MNRGIYVKLTRPEDYDDVHPDLVIEDACINPVFEPENVTDEAEALHNLLREMGCALEATLSMMDEGSYRMPLEGRKGFDTLRVLERYKEMAK